MLLRNDDEASDGDQPPGKPDDQRTGLNSLDVATGVGDDVVLS